MNLPEERGGSVVECLTRDGGVVGSSLTGGTALSLSKTLYPLLSPGSTLEDPSQNDRQTVDWEVKNQIKQTKCESTDD